MLHNARMRRFLVPCLLALLAPAMARAADEDAVPYWASINAGVANMRVGPGETYKIVWVYKRKHLPMKVIRREGPWRMLEDPDGDQGWMRDLLLTRERGAIVIGSGYAEMHAEASEGSRLLWRLEPGVVGLLGDCNSGWCKFDVDGHKGYALEDRLWGAGEP